MRHRSTTEIMCEENLLLVNTVKNYPCLYNFNIPEYTKKEDTDAAWNDVANFMGQTVQESKEKWRTLRYSFLRSLKPHPDGSAKKRYYLHSEMEFLIPFMRTLNEGPALLSQYDSDDGMHADINVEDESLGDELQLPSQDYCALEFAEPLAKRRKSTKENTECPRKMFLLSLVPEINSLTENQMKAFRRKVFALLDDVSQNDDDTQNNLTDNSENKTKEKELNIKADPL